MVKGRVRASHHDRSEGLAMDDGLPLPHRGTAAPGTPVELRVCVEHHRALGGDVDVLCLSGDLDLEGVLELRRGLPPRLAQLLPDLRGGPGGDAAAARQLAVDADPQAQRSHLVVADLAGVGFLDPSGIGGLISLHRRLEDDEGRFAVCCLQSQPRHVLAMTAADEVLSVHPTLAGALGRTPPVTPAA